MNAHPQLGWIGLGNMGTPMARRLLEAGYAVTVYNRSKDKEAPLRAAGATTAASPAALLQQADVVFLMVSDDQAIQEVFGGPDGLLAAPGPGKLLINMSTVSPGISREMAARSQEHGHSYLDAPVSGSVKQAETGQLVVMVGGDAAAYERAQPLLAHLGKLSLPLGPTGNGNLAKLAINSLLGVYAQGLAETLLFARQHGLRVEDMQTIVANSALGNVFSKLKGDAILADNYQAAFALKLLAKDLRLAQAEGLGTPLAAAVHETFQQAEPALGDEDVIAVIKHLERG
ncbi:NAD(P)-dependent oxidoreductase [Hymenobacter sp. 15J16-1T3B]|uniref:NAD(P)-dependent oxidoreductase n=1 Tax=Hymenobacter sp. 15J16-1T3B TaxID=2886941 RepID=UPI001D12E5B3|nr:NAD(P)-dependent oxidoreductase [Hymenobacter sp. 15J16-1T3B]MCC3156764.1 NAD(P)-dependent oxidoreductase [Hymenobacter sp. 15J16-1T3B]